MRKKRLQSLFELMQSSTGDDKSKPDEVEPDNIIRLNKEVVAREPDEPPEVPDTENVSEPGFIRLRNDTALIIGFAAVVLLAAAFLAGRMSVPNVVAGLSTAGENWNGRAEVRRSEPVDRTVRPPALSVNHPGPAATGRREYYSIQVASYKPSQKAMADEVVAFLKGKGFRNARRQFTGRTHVVYCGQFLKTSEPLATKALKKVRNLKYKNRKWFKKALFRKVR